MGKLSHAAATSQTLSLVAMEEASREGRREADLEHLLLALALNDQNAGQVLRGLNLSSPAIREALVAQRTEQLSALGVSSEAPETGRIVFHETAGYEWSARAIDVLKRAMDGKNKGDAAAVLRELTREPSGLIGDLLARLGTSAHEIESRLDAAERIPLHSLPRSRDEVSGFTEVFIPAEIEKVWAFLADPETMPQWEPTIGRVEMNSDPASESTDVGTTWLVHARTTWDNGKPARVKQAFRRQHVTLLTLEEGTRIAWRFSYPDAAQAQSRRLEISMTPAAGGTQLGITLAWKRSTGWRRFIGIALRPVRRFVIWINLFTISGSLSRAFR